MKIAIIIISILSIIGTLIPKDSSKYWIIRGQANFRSLYLVLNVLMLIIVLTYLPYSILKIFIAIFLVLSAIVCMKSILPYSRLFPRTIKNASYVNGKSLKLLVHNVYQYNDDYQKEIDMIKEENPDVFLFIEVNEEWDKSISTLQSQYPYFVKEIREDTYGMIMMSKIEPIEKNVNHFVFDSIPSTELVLKLHGKIIRILGIHPEPPIPGEARTSKPKDKEILKAAHYINNFPSNEIKVLIGDFNDVAWSSVSKKFKKKTGLKDVRIGRGFFSTFPSYSPIQIPLDHVFCSEELKVIDFKTLDALGSDHNPVSVTFKVPD